MPFKNPLPVERGNPRHDHSSTARSQGFSLKATFDHDGGIFRNENWNHHPRGNCSHFGFPWDDKLQQRLLGDDGELQRRLHEESFHGGNVRTSGNEHHALSYADFALWGLQFPASTGRTRPS